MRVLLLVLLSIALAQNIMAEKKQKASTLDIPADVFQVEDHKSHKVITFLGKSDDPQIQESYNKMLIAEPIEKIIETLQPIEIKQNMYFISEEQQLIKSRTPSLQDFKTLYENNKSEQPIHPKIYTAEKISEFRDDCIYVFSECHYKGTHAKSCSKHFDTFLEFPFPVQSAFIPKGNSMSLPLGRKTLFLDASVSCLKDDAIDFGTLTMGYKFIFSDGTVRE